MSNSKLFSDFSAVTTKEWKQKIQFDLKGKDYNDTLLWESNEGIHVKPFYNQEDLEDINLPDLSAQKFSVGQIIFANDEKKTNSYALKAIKNGTETIKFIIPNDTINLEALLKDIDIESVKIQFETLFFSTAYATKFTQLFQHKNISLLHDCIHQLASDGNWFSSLDEDFKTFKTICNITKTFAVKSSLYKNAGAHNIQELAYTLAHLTEYLQQINLDEDLKNETFNIHITCAVGTNYFFEIAKIRALRWLCESVIEDFSISARLYINATPTTRNKTLYDYNTNMLRTTTECMSSILGNADTIFNLPYDAVYHKSNAFGERISRNQLLILKHESYFNEVANASDGAYYIESLTQQLAEKSLSLFKEIEASGGFITQLISGTIQRKIKENAQKEQLQFNEKKLVLLGSNKFANPEDQMKDHLELFPFVKQNPRKTLIEPIITRRISENYEQERLKQEQNN
jgi:methylmalonyl-CoA mutase